MKLIVKEPFGDFRRGDEITDPAKIAEALKSNAGHVLKVASDEPASSAALPQAPGVAHTVTEPARPAD